MADIRTIAKKAGVSTATVSRVFNNKDNVSPKVKNKILKVARAHGYAPRYTARKDTVLILVEALDEIDFGNYETSLIASLSKHIFKNKLNLEIVPVGEIELLHPNFFRSAISLLWQESSIDELKTLNEDIPVVTINLPDSCFNSIYTPEDEGIMLAVSCLYKNGHRKIGMILKDGGKGNQIRMDTFKKIAIEKKLYVNDMMIQRPLSSSIIESVAKILYCGATALIICGEDWALPVNHALNLVGKRVPEDVSVISYENHRVSEYLNPPHTTIAQSFDNLARLAVETVMKIALGETSKPVKLKVAPSIIKRDSVKQL